MTGHWSCCLDSESEYGKLRMFFPVLCCVGCPEFCYVVCSVVCSKFNFLFDLWGFIPDILSSEGPGKALLLLELLWGEDCFLAPAIYSFAVWFWVSKPSQNRKCSQLLPYCFNSCRRINLMRPRWQRVDFMLKGWALILLHTLVKLWYRK